MSEFNSWAQMNWQALGTLFIQFAFLVASVWFARNILKTMRGFQEQVGVLLRRSITATSAETPLVGANARRSLAEASPYWLTPSETQTVTTPEATDRGPGRFVGAWHRLLLWLQEPISTSEASRWRRVIHWLQAQPGTDCAVF